MSDWYLGQAGFGEQIGLYNESFWRQVGSAFVWASVVIWLVLIAVAIAITLSRQAEATHAKPLGPRTPKRRVVPPPDSSGRAA
jgi:hypothetical protein